MANKKLKKKIMQVIDQNMATSRDMLDMGRESFDFSKQQYADSQAELARIRPTLDALAAGQITATTLANDITKQSWEDYNATYRPVEQQLATDALTAGSAGEQERAAGKAGIDVQRQIDIQRGANARNMASMGVNPNSGKFVSGNRTDAILGAAARAGAETGAREREKFRGDAMRTAVAGIGRGVAGTALNGVQVGGAAAGQAAGLAGAGAGQRNALGQQFLGNLSGASGLYGNAAAVNTSAANTANNLYQTNLAAAAQSSSGMAALGGGLGQLAGMGMMMSSKDVKTDKKPVSGKKAVAAVEGMPVERWKYKPGTPATDAEYGSGPEHIGPYAQDFKRETGMGDGQTINVIDAIGVNMAATKQLAKDVKALQKTIQTRGVAA